jgi:putative hydroxymethylpyrimidine transport system substrate-binding protein
MRFVAAFSSVAVLALGLVACGEKEEQPSAGTPETFDLALDFFVNPDHVGLYQALDRGYFEDAGLDIKPRVPSDPSAPIKEVAAGRVDMAISYEPEVLLARDEGLDVVAVGAMAQEPLTSLISLDKAGIEEVADLAGKTIATAGIPYQAAYLETILEGAGLSPDDVKRVDVGLSLIPAVLGGKAAAMLGGFKNIEGVELELRGKNPRVVPVDELGVPTYDELVLVAQGDRVRKDPEEIRLFLAALARGTRDAVADPAGATAALLKAADDLDPALSRAEVKETLPVLLAPEGQPYGFMDPDQWQEFAGWMFDNELVDERPAIDEALTNELLPGRIP